MATIQILLKPKFYYLLFVHQLNLTIPFTLFINTKFKINLSICKFKKHFFSSSKNALSR